VWQNDLREISMDSDSLATEDKNIHDLTDVYEEPSSVNNQEVIVVDGRGYENGAGNKSEIHTLVDVIEDPPAANKLNEDIIKRATEIAERMAREIIPEIAERVIKEEIEKLKKMSGKE
jgi:carbon monoxide dehydrogenase subunit G